MKNMMTLLAALLLTAGTASAQLDKLKLSDQIQSLKFGGDLRLRQEDFRKRGAGTTDRNRNRLRLRFGAEMQLPENVAAIFRLASGTGEQVSTNQTYSNMGSQKSIFIDQAYARWTPAFEGGSAYLASGKMQNMLWRVYSSDIVWDDDLNPEGFSEGGEWLFPSANLTVFANALQMAAHEASNTGKDPWLFSQQLGAETRLPLDSRLRAAAAYHKWSDENKMGLGQTVTQDGNQRTAGGLHLDRYGVGELTGQLSTRLGQTPLAFQGTFIRNFRHRGDIGTGAANGCAAGQVCPPARDGYQYGAILGAAKAKGTWEAACFRKYAQTNATNADLSDSDFGDGGLNRQGHIFWAAYAPQDWLQLKAKYFVTDTLDRSFTSPGDKAINRLQLDLNVRF